MHFAITIDTEVDKSPNWSVSNPESFTGVYQGVVKILQPLFQSYGVAPVYFLSNEILESPDLSSVFVPYHEGKTAELGTHLHFEAAGPLALKSIAGRHIDGIQAQLSEADERRALTWLTETFDIRFGHRPVSFRAGRYGLGEHSIKILSELGYRVDSSVTPGLCWRYRIGDSTLVCDYAHAPRHPYECAQDNAARIGSSGILEIPITLAKAPLTLRETARILIGRRRRFIWARPRFATRSELIHMIKSAATCMDPSHIIVMMFHNMEVMPARSPYCQTEAEAASYLADIEFFIRTAYRFGLRPITLRDFARFRSLSGNK